MTPSSSRFPAPQCWICRVRPADSREHKFKGSDLRRFFGRGPWTGKERPVHGRDGQDLDSIQGPGQPSMTFGLVPCSQCNNAGTQPFDRAYDTFISWVLGEGAERVLEDRRIDFSDVFGNSWEDGQRDLFRYFAKHIGCNIAAAGHAVPEDLREVPHDRRFSTALQIGFSVHDELLPAPGLDQGIFLGGLGHFTAEQMGGHPAYFTHATVSWLHVDCLYNLPLDENGATAWIANARSLALGSHRTLTDAQRQELMRRVAGLPHRPIFDGEE